MRPFIVIRPYEFTDAASHKETIRKYVMSFAFEAFISCIFREVGSFMIFPKNFELIYSISGIHSINRICGRNDVHFPGSSTNYVLHSNTAGCCLHLSVGLWNVCDKSNGAELGKF